MGISKCTAADAWSIPSNLSTGPEYWTASSPSELKALFQRLGYGLSNPSTCSTVHYQPLDQTAPSTPSTNIMRQAEHNNPSEADFSDVESPTESSIT
jgi:hypothetical protein